MAMTVVAEDLRFEFARYLTSECGLTARTAFSYDQCLRRLERVLGKAATDLSVADMRHFLRQTPYASTTKNSTLVAFKSFDRFLVLEGYRDPSAIGALRGPKITQVARQPLDPAAARVVLDACREPDQYRVVWLPLLAGTRVAETAGILEREWERPDRLHFLGKGRKYREVPVHPELARLRPTILESRSSTQGLKTACRALSHVLGLRFSPHVLRHTFAVTLRDAGVQREVIGALLGHSPLSVTEVYAQVGWQEKVDAIAQLAY